MNKHGLDVRYFKEKLGQLVRDCNNYTPAEMNLALKRLADVAAPNNECDSVAAEQSVIKITELEWSHTLLKGKRVRLADAEEAVKALGEGWRLPTRQELESLLDLTRHDPAIDTEKFPDTQSTGYWTSTPCVWSKSARWVVDFGYGVVNYDGVLDWCVRAVRSGQ